MNLFKNSFAGIVAPFRLQYEAYSLIKGAKSTILPTLNSIPSAELGLFIVLKNLYIGLVSSAGTKLLNCGSTAL